MASVTITIPNSDWSDSSISVDWNPPNASHITLGSTLSVGGSTELFLGRFILPRIPSSTIGIQLSDGSGGSEAGLGPEFSDQMENSGTITIVASNSDSLTVTGISDSSEPYVWTPSNIADVNTFANTLQGLADQSLTVTFNDSPSPEGLTLADIAIPDGRALVGEASLIEIGDSTDVYNTSDATIVDGADPPNLGAANLNPTRIYVTGNPQLRISQDGVGNIETTFVSGGAQETYQIHVQTSLTDVLSYGSTDVDATRSTNARLLLGANADPQDLLAPISALASGDRAIWFLTDSAVPMVSAGDANWTFAVPQAAVTHARANLTDAGDVAWTFAVPQPTITHALSAAYAIDAGDVSWVLAVPQAAVTHITIQPQTYTRNAGDASWLFDIPQPTVTYTAVAGTDYAVNAGNVAWAFRRCLSQRARSCWATG